MTTVSARQSEVLKFIIKFRKKHTYSPSIKEIGEHLGVHSSAAYQHVNSLVRKGLLTKEDGRARTLVPRVK